MSDDPTESRPTEHFIDAPTQAAAEAVAVDLRIEGFHAAALQDVESGAWRVFAVGARSFELVAAICKRHGCDYDGHGIYVGPLDADGAPTWGASTAHGPTEEEAAAFDELYMQLCNLFEAFHAEEFDVEKALAWHFTSPQARAFAAKALGLCGVEPVLRSA